MLIFAGTSRRATTWGGSSKIEFKPGQTEPADESRDQQCGQKRREQQEQQIVAGNKSRQADDNTRSA